MSDDSKIRVECPHCHRTVKGSARHVGKKVKCPGCAEPFMFENADTQKKQDQPARVIVGRDTAIHDGSDSKPNLVQYCVECSDLTENVAKGQRGPGDDCSQCGSFLTIALPSDEAPSLMDGNSLIAKGEELYGRDDLQGALLLFRKAVALVPPEHPHLLLDFGNAACMRGYQLDDAGLFEEGLASLERVMEYYPRFDRAQSNLTMGKSKYEELTGKSYTSVPRETRPKKSSGGADADGEIKFSGSYQIPKKVLSSHQGEISDLLMMCAQGVGQMFDDAVSASGGTLNVESFSAEQLADPPTIRFDFTLKDETSRKLIAKFLPQSFKQFMDLLKQHGVDTLMRDFRRIHGA